MSSINQSSPTKIAFCVTDLDPGGAERALVHLVTRLNRERWEPRVYCLGRPGALVPKLTQAGIQTVCLNATYWSGVTTVWKLKRELQSFQPNLIQTFLFHANLAGRVAAWLAEIPICVSGIRVAERRRKIYLSLDRWTDRLVTTHVCVSRAVARFSETIGRLPANKLAVIPNGIEFETFANATPLAIDSLVPFPIALNVDRNRPGNDQPHHQTWCTAGRLDTQKDPWTLLETVRKLLPDHPNLQLLWAGDGPLRNAMQNWITQHGLGKTIHLLGWRADIPQLMRACQGFVLTSRWEGMPNVLLEAMAAGLPVISTRVEGADELIMDGVTGWLVPISDTSALAHTWSECLRSPERLQDVASRGQDHVRDHYSWEKMSQSYERLYERLLATTE